MSLLLDIKKRNAVLLDMAQLLGKERTAILAANKIDMDSYLGDDIAMRDRLKVDQGKNRWYDFEPATTCGSGRPFGC